MKRSGNPPCYTLPLFGRPRLLSGLEEVRLSRKGLALLYYLALEGPTSRARLADLLYGHGAGLQNLRVELHRLARALGERPFPPGQDPLALPPWIQLGATGQGEVLEGLEAVEGLWDWVQEVRLRWERRPPVPIREALVRELATLPLPLVLVLKGRAGAGKRDLAQALAQALGLPFHEGLRPQGLSYLEGPFPPSLLREVLAHRGLVVLNLEPGEEPRAFLELRAHYPPERPRVVDLPPLTWSEARRGPLAGLPSLEAARIYFLSGGQPEWMADWLACADLPQRPLAQLRLQARWLSEPARMALERLSVVGGSLPEPVLEALEAYPYLGELERKGWLVYREGYRFAKEAERRLLSQALPPGWRRELQERAAAALALAGLAREEALMRLAMGEEAWSLLPTSLRQAFPPRPFPTASWAWAGSRPCSRGGQGPGGGTCGVCRRLAGAGGGGLFGLCPPGGEPGAGGEGGGLQPGARGGALLGPRYPSRCPDPGLCP
ncbi:hypothetical protein [Thermus sp.]|uniref:hypothetical protein n=1 Tax=Thermus sp. TaxID=275 RepID=UPI00298F1A92|nr:hypothetical protein [Thermus sp.]MDW8358676.1 hypothetical protein [Thermus sp.]